MKDFKITDDGMFVIAASSGDLEMVEGDAALAQQIIFRLKTFKGDWTLSPDCGASLEQFIGQPNTRSTRNLIEQAIKSELARGGLVISPTVTCIQLSEEEVYILVEFASIETSGKKLQIDSQLDLRTGKVFARALNK